MRSRSCDKSFKFLSSRIFLSKLLSFDRFSSALTGNKKKIGKLEKHSELNYGGSRLAILESHGANESPNYF